MTHINAYKMDVKDAYNKAVNALSEFKTKVDGLQAKHDEDEATRLDNGAVESTVSDTDNAQVGEPSNGADDAPVGPGTTDELKQKESDKSGDNYTDKSHSSSSSVTKSK